MTEEILVGIAKDLGRLDGKVDMILEALPKLTARQLSNEQKIHYGYGVAAALTLFAGKLAFWPH